MDVTIIVNSIVLILLLALFFFVVQQSRKDKENEKIRKIEELYRLSSEEQKETIKQLVENSSKSQQKQLQEGMRAQFEQFATINREINTTLEKSREEMHSTLVKNRDEMSKHFREERTLLNEELAKNRSNMSRELASNREELNVQLLANRTESNNKIQELNLTLETKIKALQESNEKRLSQMQDVVDEKLQKTLNERISQSFEQVTKHLSNVEQGLGKMQSLASDVGSLKNVMSNVKTRGIIGEIQLGRILEEMFTSSQYREQVNIKDRNSVDFAVVLPGKNNDEVLLPIDSKFPQDDYIRLTEAMEIGDKEQIDLVRKALYQAVKTQAKSIHDKYIDPPKTTDFAILFLPTEGLFLEIVNNQELYESLSRDYKVNVTGPTTMSAVLNSLQMGFKTLQIEQKSSEVYKMLGIIKTEFGKFEDTLKKVHDRIKQSEEEINTLRTTRTNVMNRRLRGIEAIEVTVEEKSAVIEMEDFESDLE